MLLAKPERHWRTGYSAKTLAYCWQEADDFPESIKRVFKNSGIELFQNVELLLAFPEYKVPLPGGRRASQNDIFALAKGRNQLISIAIEGKVSEPFDTCIAEWKLEASKGKKTRLQFLCHKLQLYKNKIDHVRYQLLHRTASAIIEAEKFNAQNALMLVHSFSQSDEWFDDYRQFLALFGLKEIRTDSLVYAKTINGIDLYFSWVKGEKEYLSR
ncbi:MAG: hypothetical protein PHR56_07415 [Dehalococcoidales bacterium]|nr:hypothetical protein [Dehalococcoidales bacterium]